VIVVVAHLFGRRARRLGQPPVLGEIVGGIALGPSVLGAVWPAAADELFPAGMVSSLHPLADIGLVLFMFAMGVEFDRAHLRGHWNRAVVASQASIGVPFTGGALSAWWLHGVLDVEAELLPFCLFIGAAMAVTAFPVLAKILQQAGPGCRPGRPARTGAAPAPSPS
jgi:Kef-type K+ transport system membrane component KefB